MLQAEDYSLKLYLGGKGEIAVVCIITVNVVPQVKTSPQVEPPLTLSHRSRSR